MRAGAIAPLLAPAAIAVLALPLLWPTPLVGDNFQFWAAGHMVATGQSPYDRASWVAAEAYGPVPGGVAFNTVGLNLAITRQVWLYPPQTAFLFAPFGALPLEIGVPLLHLFVLLTALAGLTLAAWLAGLRGPALSVALALGVVSQPFVISVRNGHAIGVLLIGGALLLRGLAARDVRAVAIGAALLSVKPQLMLPIGLAAAVYALAQRDGRALAAMAIGAIAVTLPFELITPFPFAALLASGEERLAVDLSTLPALARDLGGGTVLAIALAGVSVGLCTLATVRAPRRWRDRVAAGSLFALSPALVPYTHDYDLLVAVPAMFVAVALAVAVGHARVGLAVAAAGLFLAPWILFYWWPLLGESSRRLLGGPLGAVPLVFVIALAGVVSLAWLRDRRVAALEPTPDPPQREVA